MAEPFLVVELPDQGATELLAEDVAACLRRGDAVALSGELGAGKTTFARALLRSLAGDLALEVPSPTFTLVQPYDLPRFPVAHVDLYRVTDPAEIEETGMLEALGDGAVIVEWPDRAEQLLPREALRMALEIAGSGRRALLTGGKDWQERIRRSRSARDFLEANGFAGAHRLATAAWSSAPIGEPVVGPDRTARLVAWPDDADPRASSLDARIAGNGDLRRAGLSAPELIAADRRRGLALVEDLGDERLVDANGPIPERAFVAIEALAELHVRARPTEVSHGGARHVIPELGRAGLASDAAHFADAYLPRVAQTALPARERREFERLWRAVFERLVDVERSWIVRPLGWHDLVWLPKRQGLQRVGFAFAGELLVGPAAYNVATLCQDATLPVSPQLEADLLRHYLALRHSADAHFDSDRFSIGYAIITAALATHGLGVASLHARAGTEDEATGRRRLGYLHRALAHPVLSDLAVWYERHVPTLPRGRLTQ
jgi:tRNA threonylcarbamoyl adenosine modification protein YjeE